jgi:hypothetical protein
VGQPRIQGLSLPEHRYYGKTKSGEYLSEAQAKLEGFRPDHGKTCEQRAAG